MTKIRDMSKLEAAAMKMGITGEELRAFLPLMLEVQEEINKEKIKNLKKATEKAKGGNIEKQMEMFQDGGLKDEGNTVDPVSGNDVPPGATQEEVRDDIPAQLSEGEFVFPADVVRYIGLEKLMRLRQEAKMGLKMMEEMGQMGNADEATIPDDIPFSIIDINMSEEDDEVEKRAEGGVIEAANGFAGTTTTTNPLTTVPSNIQGSPTGLRSSYTAPSIPTPTTAPIGGFKYKSPIDTTKKFTYSGALGEDLSQAPDEYRTYVNDAGAEIQIPFKNGEILTGFSVPEGFKAKTDSPLAPKIQTARTKTARVEQQTGSDDSDSEMADLGGARTTIGDVEYAVQYNLDGTVGIQSLENYRNTGQVNFQTVTKDTADLIKDQTKGQIAQLAYGPRSRLAVELARKAGITIPGATKVEDLIDVSVDATKKLKNKKTEEDIFGRQIGQRAKTKTFDSLTRAQQRAIQEGKGRNVGLSDKFIKDLDIEDAAKKGRLALDTSPEPTDKGPGGDSRGGFGTTSFDPNETDDSFQSTTDAFSGMSGDSYDYGATNKGAFVTKKRPSKIKKMKRGGLASKK